MEFGKRWRQGATDFIWRLAFVGLMNSFRVVITLELQELSLQIDLIPEHRMVEILTSNRSDQALYKRVRNRNMGHRLDLVDFEDPKVRFPPMEFEEWIVI